MRDPDPQGSVGRLKRRADFVRTAKGKRWHGEALSLQGIATKANTGPRVGLTLTRKVGCAVIRNRARRRLKEALRMAPDLPLRAGHDYVIVGRLPAIRLPFETLKSELFRAISGLHEAREPPRRFGGRRGPKSKPQQNRPERTRLKP